MMGFRFLVSSIFYMISFLVNRGDLTAASGVNGVCSILRFAVFLFWWSIDEFSAKIWGFVSLALNIHLL